MIQAQVSQFETHDGQQLDVDALINRLSNLAFCLTDKDGNYVEVNAAYEKLYGYTSEELIGQHFTKVVPESHREFAREMHDAFIAGGIEPPANWTVVNKQGEAIQIEVEAIRCRNEENQPQKLTVIRPLE